jgi:hypothetical protein
MTDTPLSSPVSPVQRNPFVALLTVLLSLLDRLAGWWLNWRMKRAIANQPDLARFEAELQRINTALAHCGIVGIADEFHDAADAITQMAGYIQELERAWNQLGEPEDYADHADNVFEVTP